MSSHPVPDGKRVLNIHVSVDEHLYLKAAAQRRGVTVTQVVRDLVRQEMKRSPSGTWDFSEVGPAR